MRIMVTGARGMLGRTLCRRWAARHEIIPADIQEFDITDPRATDAAVAAASPDVVVHCAAHTQVDRCESEVEAAFAINAVGAANVAAACRRSGARMAAISTDYVFPGDSQSPYHEWAPTGPRTVYGASKLAGEEAVLRHCPDSCVVRTAWLYGQGGPSFLHTMARLGAEEGPPLKVVNDQLGNPTSADAVADALLGILERGAVGIIHASCEGEATWFDFARAILEAKGLARPIAPCATAEFPRPAPRPANSRLDKMALRILKLPPMPGWREALGRFIEEYPDG